MLCVISELLLCVVSRVVLCVIFELVSCVLKGLTADAADPDLVAFVDTSVCECTVVEVIDLASTS